MGVVEINTTMQCETLDLPNYYTHVLPARPLVEKCCQGSGCVPVYVWSVGSEGGLRDMGWERFGGDVVPVFVPLHYVLVVEIEQENLTNIDLL